MLLFFFPPLIIKIAEVPRYALNHFLLCPFFERIIPYLCSYVARSNETWSIYSPRLEGNKSNKHTGEKKIARAWKGIIKSFQKQKQTFIIANDIFSIYLWLYEKRILYPVIYICISEEIFETCTVEKHLLLQK